MGRGAEMRMRIAMGGIVLVAAIVRLAVAWTWPSVVHADETFQYLEPAYHLVTGRGLVPWEYRVAARSWLLPGALVPLVWATRLVSSDPAVLRLAVSALGVVLSLVGVVAAAAIGRRVAGRAGAMWTAGIAALWPELVQMAPHVLADTVAGALLIAGLAVAYRRTPGARRLATAGLVLGLAAVVRPQIAPAVVVAALGLALGQGGRVSLARLLPLGIGGAGALALYGVVDWLSWGTPFLSLVRYVRINQAGVADTFGRAPALAYVTDALAAWGWAVLPVLATAAIGARRAPLPALVAGAVVLVFSAVGHKEVRFVYPALPLLFALCGIGTAEIVRDVGQGALAKAGAAAVWLVAIAAAATTPAMTARRLSGAGTLAALDAINRDPAACGVGLVAPAGWMDTGLSRLRDGIGVHAGDGNARAFDRLLVMDTPPEAPPLAGYGAPVCYRGDRLACVWRRAGGCAGGGQVDTAPSPAVIAVLRREGLW